MMVLRDSQMNLLSKTAYDFFVESAVDHIAAFAPDTYTTIGRERVRASVEYGMAKATCLGFTSKGSTLFLLECMYSFGSEFDTDPTLAWASEALNDTTIDLPETRAARLYDGMNTFSSLVFGEHHSYFLLALQELTRLIKAPLTFDAATFESAMLSLLYRVFPRRCVQCGDQILRLLVQKGVREVTGLGIESRRATAMVIFLMLFLGHGVLNDQIHYWIGDTLKIKKDTDEIPDRAHMLEKKVGLFLEKTLIRLGQTHVLIR
jgi:hypothetical protein